MQSMSQLVGISKFGSNADTSLSANQHYDRQRIFYVPSPYSAFLACVHQDLSSYFVKWIATLSSHGKHRKLTIAGHQLFQTFQSELRRQPEVPNTQYARWINSYPCSWHQSLSQHSSTAWKLVNSILDSSLSSISLDTIPDFAIWLAAAIWTACIHDQSLEVGERVDRLNTQVEATIEELSSTQLPPLRPPNTDAVENFQCKIKNSSHTCWDGHDPRWYASAVSYLNDDNDPEFVPGPGHTKWRKWKEASVASHWRECKECSLIDHAHELIKALSSSSHPSAQFSTLSAAMVSKCCANRDGTTINNITARAVPATSRCHRVCVC